MNVDTNISIKEFKENSIEGLGVLQFVEPLGIRKITLERVGFSYRLIFHTKESTISEFTLNGATLSFFYYFTPRINSTTYYELNTRLTTNSDQIDIPTVEYYQNVRLNKVIYSFIENAIKQLTLNKHLEEHSLV